MKNKKVTTIEDAEPFVDYEALAEKAKASVGFFKKAKREWGLPHYKIGHLVRFRWSEVERWLQERHVS